MRFKDYLKEEYIKGVDTFKKYLEIFLNPSTKELLSAAKQGYPNLVRYIADLKKKKFFVFSGSLLHDAAIRELRNEGYKLPNVRNLPGSLTIVGSGYIKGNKIDPDNLYNNYPTEKLLTIIKKENLSWIQKWFSWSTNKMIEYFYGPNGMGDPCDY